MPTNQTTALATLTTPIARRFAKSAAGPLNWGHEREFLKAHLLKTWQLKKFALEDPREETIESIRSAVLQIAAMGLSMNPTQQYVYLIPRRLRKQRTGEGKHEYEKSVPFIAGVHPSYRGMSFIACNYANAELMAAEIVFENCQFNYFGPLKAPDHRVTTNASDRSWNKATGVYAMVIMKSGHVRAEYLDRSQVLKIQALSEFPAGMMWNPEKLWTEGWKKAAIRRVCKLTMTTCPQMIAANESLNTFEGSVFENEPEAPAALSAPQTHTDAGMDGLQRQMHERFGERGDDDRVPTRADIEQAFEANTFEAEAPNEHNEAGDAYLEKIGECKTLGDLEAVGAELFNFEAGDDHARLEQTYKLRRAALRI